MSLESRFCKAKTRPLCKAKKICFYVIMSKKNNDLITNGRTSRASLQFTNNY